MHVITLMSKLIICLMCLFVKIFDVYYPLLSTGSNLKDLSPHDGEIVEWDIKNHNKQNHLM